MKIIINGEIDERTYMNIRLLLFKAKDAQTSEIDLYIASCGGEIFYGLGIVEAIRDLQATGTKVIGRVEGLAASMAMMILQACDERYIGKNSWVMLHGPTSEGIGEMDIKDSKTELEFLMRMSTQLAILLASRCTSKDPVLKDSEHWREIFDSNSPKFYNAEEALTYGLVDKVI